MISRVVPLAERRPPDQIAPGQMYRSLLEGSLPPNLIFRGFIGAAAARRMRALSSYGNLKSPIDRIDFRLIRGVLDFSAMAAAALMADLLPEGGAARRGPGRSNSSAAWC